MFFNQYPYVNVNDLNLDYILNAIKTFQNEVTNFVSINAIKYANPIQWDITKQYEKNTIVIDPVTGTAYISVAPVPEGVALTRPEYWTVVFDLQSFVTKANQNIANNYEEQTTTTATMNTAEGNWVIWGDVLYKALVNITAGDAYVVNSNISRLTIEDVYREYINTINGVLASIGEIVDLETADKSNLVAAINELNGRLNNDDDRLTVIDGRLDGIDNNISTLSQDLNDTEQNLSDLTTLVNTINESVTELTTDKIIVKVESYGAVGDGVTDDSAAINLAFNSGYDVAFSKGKTYAISNPIESPITCKIYGNGAIIKVLADMTAVLTTAFVSDLTIDGNLKQIQYGIYTSDTSNNARIYNCTVHGLRHATLDVHAILNVDTTNKDTVYIVDSCTAYDLYSTDNGVISDPQGSATGITSYSVTKCYIVNNTIYDVKSTDDGYGIYALNYHGYHNAAYVANNTLHDIANTGIKIQVNNAVIANNTITKNSKTIPNAMAYCMRIYGNNVNVRENTFLNTGTNSYFLFVDGGANVKIIDNTFDIDNGNLAIKSTGGKTLIRGCMFSTTGTSPSIYLISLESNTAIMEDNIIYCNYTYVISMIGGGHRINNNLILGGTAFAIEASYATNVTITNNIIEGTLVFPQKCTNSIINNNHVTLISFTHGCELTSVNNNVLGSATTALSMSGGKGCSICNNISTTATVAIAATYCTDCIIKNNILNAGASLDTAGTTGGVVADNIVLSA